MICCNNDTWELWIQFFDAQSSGDLVNSDTEEKYIVGTRDRQKDLVKCF